MLSWPTKLKKISTFHIQSNNPQVAYAVYTLKNCHDEIMALAKHFTEWLGMNASENFHIKLHKCILKVIKPPIIWEPHLQPLEVTHAIQLCHACIYKNLQP